MYQIKRAIILAAGRGERLRPYTDKIPKPLLNVRGKPIIEYAIEALHERNITDITIVVGYRARQFKYLRRKYGVSLRRNRYFNKGSNLLSIKCVLDKLNDCVILDGDIIIKPAAIRKLVSGAAYSYVKEKCAHEWALETDSYRHITKIIPDLTEKHNFKALHSISYWVGDQAKQFRQMLHDAKDDVNYYDDIAIKIPGLYAYEMKHSDFIEIDTVEEYEHEIQRFVE